MRYDAFLYPGSHCLSHTGVHFADRVLRCKFIWWSITAVAVLDLICYLSEFLYYESRGLFIVFTLMQLVVMAVVIPVIKYISRKKHKE